MKNKITTIFITAFVLGMFLWNLLGTPPEYSDSERRVLASFPEVTLENITSGKFAKQFEKYATDRFPARDIWRRMKAYTQIQVFRQKDNNNLYTSSGHISKLEYPMNTAMMDHSIQLFTKIKDKYLDSNPIYFAIIPDKNRYLASPNDYLSLDYEVFTQYMKEHMNFAEYIEIADLLEADDYYKTDTHWRQEAIIDVSERIASEMGTNISQPFHTNTLESPFYGVYAGQSALVCEPDTIMYLTNDTIESAEVDGDVLIYDMTKAGSKDPYEMFLSGNQPIVRIRNAQNESGKQLIMFRDSFGSSIAPLFIKGYSEIVLVDLRYISSEVLDEYVEFENADILFLYSTLLLNNSLSMK